MTKEELYSNFATNIEIERQKLGFSQKKMAESLDMSLSTYKSMIQGTQVNISLYTMYCACQITGKLVYELAGYFQNSLQEQELLKAYRQFPPHKKQAMLTHVCLEKDFSNLEEEIRKTKNPQERFVTCYYPTGNFDDGMMLDSTNTSPLDVSVYDKICAESIDCAIAVLSNHLHPVYHLNDILLIHQSAPRDGDTAVFIHKDTRRMYIRRFRQTDPSQLIPINGMGSIIYVNSHSREEMNKWIKFGKVLMRITPP